MSQSCISLVVVRGPRHLCPYLYLWKGILSLTDPHNEPVMHQSGEGGTKAVPIDSPGLALARMIHVGWGHRPAVGFKDVQDHLLQRGLCARHDGWFSCLRSKVCFP